MEESRNIYYFWNIHIHPHVSSGTNRSAGLLTLIYMQRQFFFLLTVSTVFYALISCQSPGQDGVPVVGFVEAFEDATIAQARQGFVDALRDSGYSEEAGTVRMIYRNAQGDASTLN